MVKKLSNKAITQAAPEVMIDFFKGESYEIELFVAKKCLNLSQLYEKIYLLLNNVQSLISGYSLYEVEGDWRTKIDVSKEHARDFQKLKALQNKHGKGAFKDLIRPLIDTGKDKFAVFDESSVVLKIIIQSLGPIDWSDTDNAVIREIKAVFADIAKTEKSIFFTIKPLAKTGTIQRKHL